MPTFVVGSGVGDTYATVLLTFPAVDWFKWAILGALDELTADFNWVEAGDVAVSFAVEESERMIATYKFMNFNPFPPGIILPFGAAAAPPGYLLCDGSSYATADFPELFAALGYAFGGSGSSFQVPNLTDNVVIGAGGAYALAAVGGEAAHQLTENELAAHVHTIPLTATTLAVEPGEVTVMTPIPILTQNTGSTGGDVPHNNLQPYQAITYVIYAGR